MERVVSPESERAALTVLNLNVPDDDDDDDGGGGGGGGDLHFNRHL
jgi:hypothetical protein